jgi:LysR family hydrogen peroxide-inducible transcriptional activator
LSTAIQNLEEHFGCQLLERDHKTFIFTALGLDIVERSKKILNDASDLVDFAQNAGNWESGQLKLGVIPTIAPFLFQQMFGAFASFLPSIQLELQEDTTENLLTQLNDGELDLLVLALPMATPGCKQMVIGHDPFHLVAHADTVPSLPSPMNIDALPKKSIFLLQQEHCMTEHAVSACNLQHKDVVSSLSASSLYTLVQLANSKLGYTFVPELAINQGILNQTDLSALPAEDKAYREIGLVWRTGTTRMRLFRRVAEVLSPLMPKPALA